MLFVPIMPALIRVKQQVYIIGELFKSQSLILCQKVLFQLPVKFWWPAIRITFRPATSPFDMKRFRPLGQVDSLPVTYSLGRNIKTSAGLPAPQFFITHGFHNHLFKLSCISFLGYSFCHRKTPHFLVQVLYHTCLTNGGQFICVRFLYAAHSEGELIAVYRAVEQTDVRTAHTVKTDEHCIGSRRNRSIVPSGDHRSLLRISL